MNRIQHLLLFTSVSLLFNACNDLFEKDISKEHVVLLAPADGKTVNSGTIEFWWEEVEDATTYEIHLVKGSFDAPEALEADSSVSGNIFSLYLTAGVYEWKIVAKNESSKTESAIYHLTVDSTFSLAEEKVVLVYPNQNHCTNDSTVMFRWVNLGIPGVRYAIDVRIGDFAEGLTVYSYETTLNQQSITINEDFEGALSWGVRAVNDEGASPYSSFSFHLDRTAPAMVSLVAPVNGDSVPELDIDFSWTGTQGNGCEEWDSISIYSDSLGQTIALKKQLEAGVNQFTENLNPGFYWWEVFRYDRAGNVSASSGIEKFYAKPE